MVTMVEIKFVRAATKVCPSYVHVTLTYLAQMAVRVWRLPVRARCGKLCQGIIAVMLPSHPFLYLRSPVVGSGLIVW